MNRGVDMIQKTPGKIDYSIKHGIMVGYIDRSQNVVAVESGWKITPEEMAKFLTEKFSSIEKAREVVDSPILVPTFKKDDYCYVDGFGDVIESNLSWNKEEMRKEVGHLFLFMKGAWQYSDNGIDWEPADEALPMPREVA
tara:strand:- start:666 stop:1085 length:420 start_codon:yes stop_codon:yes gene_type:complete